MEGVRRANSITIPSLGRIDDPFGVLSEACKGLYDIYDGVPVGQENAIEVLDIVLTASLNSHLTDKRISALYQSRQGIEEALSKVPASASLLDETWPREALLDLLLRTCEVEGAWFAIATKILHRKRPRLIPILDDRILRHYAYRDHVRGTKWPEDREIAEKALDGFRRDLVAVGCDLADLVGQLEAANGWRITVVRALDMLVWHFVGSQGLG